MLQPLRKITMSRKITAVRIHHGWERMLRPWKHVGQPPEMYVRLPKNLCSSAGKNNFRACGKKGGGCGKVCSAAGALFSRREKVFGILEKGRGCGKGCSAARAFVQPPGKRVFGPLEKGGGCGKVCSVAGAFVQPPGVFILRKREM